LVQAAVEDAMEMYQELHMFEDAVRVAAQRGHEDLEEMRSSYFQYLLQSHQARLRSVVPSLC
jgi:intraflagellar transport protein 172